jgi:hypothetical protein
MEAGQAEMLCLTIHFHKSYNVSVFHLPIPNPFFLPKNDSELVFSTFNDSGKRWESIAFLDSSPVKRGFRAGRKWQPFYPQQNETDRFESRHTILYVSQAFALAMQRGGERPCRTGSGS